MSVFNIFAYEDEPFAGDVITEYEFIKLKHKFNVIYTYISEIRIKLIFMNVINTDAKTTNNNCRHYCVYCWVTSFKKIKYCNFNNFMKILMKQVKKYGH